MKNKTNKNRKLENHCGGQQKKIAAIPRHSMPASCDIVNMSL
jgi:hypothetical protein